MQEHILSVTNLSKSFSGTLALDAVHLELHKGEVHALMGENGAGKSTFMKILIGMLKSDAGTIRFEGRDIDSAKDQDLLKKSIAMIHQELLVIPGLTVAQNIFLGREKEFSNSFWLRDEKINKAAKAILSQMGLDIDPKTPIKNLSVSEIQMIEIAKAISLNAKVIIMDEPTSAISDKEVTMLFRLIADLKAKGVSIIYISHKMDEIFRIADRITVLRDGKYITTKNASELNHDQLITLMVGREINQLYVDEVIAVGEPLLEVQNLSRNGAFVNINFKVHAGEIVGLAGLMGAGRSEIARTIFGLDKADSGEIRIENVPVKITSPKVAIANGIGYVSEDRKSFGFIPKMSVKQNLTLSSLQKHKHGVFINAQTEEATVLRNITELKIKASNSAQYVGELSGGNQQKVVLGRVLNTSPNIIILDEPTRGVDVGAKFEIYKLINNLKKQGKAIILISSELPEILGLCDRIMVISKGKQTAILNREQASEELIMKFAVQ